MGTLNAILTGLFDLLLWPFRGIAPIWSLTLISALSGILLLWIFGKVSNQTAIRRVRDKIRGNLIGIRLFGDDLAMLFKLQARIFRFTLSYLGYAIVPFIVMLIPMLPILMQLNLRYSTAPLQPGDEAVVTAKVIDVPVMRESIELEVPDGIVVETEGVRIPSLGEVAWRIRADEPGEYTIKVKGKGAEIEKALRVGGGWGKTSSLRTNSTGDLFDPGNTVGEKPIAAASGFQSVSVTYHRAQPLNFLFFDVNAVPGGWLIFFFVVSLAFGFAFKGVLGVEI